MIARRILRSAVFAALGLAVVVGALRLAATAANVAPRDTTVSALELVRLSLSEPVGAASVDATETLARPVFSPTRRPYVAPPPEPLPAVVETTPAEVRPEEPPPVEFSLIGVFIRGAERKALLVSAPFPEGKWFRVGEDLGGWTLAVIDRESVEIASDASALKLQLYVDKSTTN